MEDYRIDDPVKEINDVPYISMPYLIKGLRDIQSGRYAIPECEKEYICIENMIQYFTFISNHK